MRQTIYIDPTGLTYVLVDTIIETVLEDFRTIEDFDFRGVIDRVNEHAATPCFDGFRRIEFYRICGEVFRQRAMSQPKPMVVILRQAAAIVHEMYKTEVGQDG